MEREIKYGVIHCTAGPRNQPTQEILNYWKKHNGWKTPGYHELIGEDKWESLWPISKPSNGVKGFNKNAIHICCKGGQGGVDDRTDWMKGTLLERMMFYKHMFPNIIWKGHRDFSTDINGNGILERWEFIKFCPGYDLQDWLSKIGLDKNLTPVNIVYKLNYPLIKNDFVKKIQRALGIKADGIFGGDTDRAVKLFQAKNGLAVDGIVGPKTLKAMGL